MGILVRLILSLAGGVVGAAVYASGPLAVGMIGVHWISVQIVAGRLSPQYLWPTRIAVIALLLVLVACIERGAKRGYKIGLEMGRAICFAPQPEQNSRVNLNVNVQDKKKAT